MDKQEVLTYTKTSLDPRTIFNGKNVNIFVQKSNFLRLLAAIILLFLQSQIMSISLEILLTTLTVIWRTVHCDILVIGGPKNDTMYKFAAMPASFGPEIPGEGVEGYLLLADPLTACQPVPSPPDTNGTYAWILLIKRGQCDFDRKILNAQKAGYVAAVVYNNGSQNLVPMGGSKEKEIIIPAVFVSYRDGIFLSADFLYSPAVENPYYVVITPEYPVISLNAILLPFAIVVGICFFALTMVLVAKYWRDRRRRRRHRLPRSQLKKLPIRKFKKGEGNDVCAICLDEFEEGDKVRVLPCHHQYHCKCIDPWLLNNRRQCPVCKRKVIPGDSSDDEATVQSSNTTPHRSASNISESTPLLASSVQPSQSGLPLQNDILVTQVGPPRLVNVEFLSDDEEDYDGDTEEAHDNAGMVHDEVYPSTSGLAHSVETFKESPGEGEATTAVKVEDEPDVPLISLTDSRTVNV